VWGGGVFVERHKCQKPEKGKNNDVIIKPYNEEKKAPRNLKTSGHSSLSGQKTKKGQARKRTEAFQVKRFG